VIATASQTSKANRLSDDLEGARSTISSQSGTISSLEGNVSSLRGQVSGLEADLVTSRTATSDAQEEADRNAALAIKAGALADELQTCVGGMLEVTSSMLGSYYGIPNQRLFDRVMGQCGTAIDSAGEFSDDLTAS
jgi:hypothetical protein